MLTTGGGYFGGSASSGSFERGFDGQASLTALLRGKPLICNVAMRRVNGSGSDAVPDAASVTVSAVGR